MILLIIIILLCGFLFLYSVGNRANIIVHHTRDTESKQWDEMRVLSLQGIAQVASCAKFGGVT